MPGDKLYVVKREIINGTVKHTGIVAGPFDTSEEARDYCAQFTETDTVWYLVCDEGILKARGWLKAKE